ncbi:MAG: hypothetical protein Aurels2KO_58660 [Aureliella sp.]
MEYVRLGSSDLMVSEACLGTMTFGRAHTYEDGCRQMDYALSQGVNFFDTGAM